MFFFLFQDAYVEGLDDDTLFRSMYEDDVEGKKMNELPGVPSEVSVYPLSSIRTQEILMTTHESDMIHKLVYELNSYSEQTLLSSLLFLSPCAHKKIKYKTHLNVIPVCRHLYLKLSLNSLPSQLGL